MASRMQAGSFAEELHRRMIKMRQLVIDALAHGLNTPGIRGKHRQVGEQLAELAVAVTALEVQTRELVETLRATNVIPIGAEEDSQAPALIVCGAERKRIKQTRLYAFQPR